MDELTDLLERQDRAAELDPAVLDDIRAGHGDARPY